MAYTCPALPTKPEGTLPIIDKAVSQSSEMEHRKEPTFA